MTKEKEHTDIMEEFEAKGASIVDRLTHDELLRAQALSQACGYYVQTIVKDGELYREMMREGRVLKPATYIGVIETAISFEAYLRGDLKRTVDAIALKKYLQGVDEEMEALDAQSKENEKAMDEAEIEGDGSEAERKP